MPFPVLWDAWRSMQSVVAWQRLMITRAISLSRPSTEEQAANHARAFELEMSTAFPADGPDGRP